MASSIAGDFKTPGRPTSHPQRLGTSVQSLFRWGRIPSLLPINEPHATITGTATNSGAHCMRSAMSITQGRSDSGRNSSLNAATGKSPSGKGFGVTMQTHGLARLHLSVGRRFRGEPFVALL